VEYVKRLGAAQMRLVRAFIRYGNTYQTAKEAQTLDILRSKHIYSNCMLQQLTASQRTGLQSKGKEHTIKRVVIQTIELRDVRHKTIKRLSEVGRIRNN